MDQLVLRPVAEPDKNKLEDAYEVAADYAVAYEHEIVRVPRFFQYDGASIPAALWQVVGSPFNPRFMTAAAVHDWVYHTHQLGREDADELFHRLLLRSGVHGVRAFLMREAVQEFGGFYWKNDEDDLAYLDRLKQRILGDGRSPTEYGLT